MVQADVPDGWIVPKSVTDLKIFCYKFPTNVIYPLHLTTLECMFSKIVTGMIPPTVQTLVFLNEVKHIEIGSIPSSVTRLEFTHHKNPPIDPSIIKSLTSLSHLCLKVRNVFDVYEFPESLTYLYVQFRGINCIETLPKGLKTFIYCSRIHRFQFKTKDLPPTLESLSITLKRLVLSTQFNNELPPLPETLETLIFGDSYNQPFSIDSLPKNLKTLVVGYNFDHPIGPGVLPDSLTDLDFDMRSFNHQICLPSRCYIRKLKIGALFISSTKVGVQLGEIPNSVTDLSLFHNSLNVKLIPDSVTRLKIVGCDSQLVIPDSVKKLIIDHYESPIPFGVTRLNFSPTHSLVDPFKKNNIPSSVTKLTLIDDRYWFIQTSLTNLTHLNIKSIDRPIQDFFDSLPPSISHLKVQGVSFNVQPKDHRQIIIPRSITHLTVDYCADIDSLLGIVSQSFRCNDLHLRFEIDTALSKILSNIKRLLSVMKQPLVINNTTIHRTEDEEIYFIENSYLGTGQFLKFTEPTQEIIIRSYFQISPLKTDNIIF
eukprot:gene3952-4937_t